VIKEVERHLKSYTLYEVDYLIELKSSETGDGTNHPPPAEFSNKVFEVIDAYLPLSRVVIQSFDFRILKYWNVNYPEVRLSALVADIKSDETVLEKLGFNPHFYSPYYKLIRKRTIKDLHELGIKVYPWTVNDEKDMEKMMKWDVDGIITDYPNILSRLILESSTN
jgi:glycerophosphoryl diester phosphodiesterase